MTDDTQQAENTQNIKNGAEPTPEDTQDAEDTQPEPENPFEALYNGKIEALEAQVESLKNEARTNLEGWQRARAEFANYKKRIERERSEEKQRVTQDTLTQVLPMIDNFERAVANVPDDLQDHPWVSGTALILKDFEKLLDKHDVEIIDPVGEPFDPRLHEAIGMDDSSNMESGHVTTTLLKGYRSGERVLRPAMVRVAN